MSDQADRIVLPIRRPPFKGVANQAFGGSQPDWGPIGHVKPPAGTPNVLLVLIDDAGFGNLHRPHRTLGQPDPRTSSPVRPWPEPITEPGQITRMQIRRQDRLAGTLHEYRHAA